MSGQIMQFSGQIQNSSQKLRIKNWKFRGAEKLSTSDGQNQVRWAFWKNFSPRQPATKWQVDAGWIYGIASSTYVSSLRMQRSTE